MARNCKSAGVKAHQLAQDAGAIYAVKVAHGDDKCKIPFGAPGDYLSATARAHAGGGVHDSLVREGETLAALDHDHYKRMVL